VNRVAVPPPHAQVPYLCECDTLHCTELLRLTQAEYAEASGGLRRFIVAPGHKIAHGEVVHKDDRFWAVERRT
jgi:hypothetical protein